MYELMKLKSATRTAIRTAKGSRIKLLLALDDPHGFAAMRCAMLAEQLGAEVELMTTRAARSGVGCATTLSRKRFLGRDAIARLVNRASFEPSRTPASTIVNRDGTACALAVHASESDAGLVVIHADYQERFAYFFRRNVAGKLLRHCSRPLLFVRAMPQSAYRHVVVATDFSTAANEAVRTAIAIAPHARITFLHAARLHDEDMMHELGVPCATIRIFRKKICHTGRERLQQLARQLGIDPLTAASVVEHGSAEHVVASCVLRTGADLVCAGKHRRSWFEERFSGSVALHRLCANRADLLVVPRSHHLYTSTNNDGNTLV